MVLLTAGTLRASRRSQQASTGADKPRDTSKSPVKKTPVKKTPAKKTPAKKTPAAKKSTAKITFDEDFAGYESTEEAEPPLPNPDDDSDSDSEMEEVSNSAAKETTLTRRAAERSSVVPTKKKQRKKKVASESESEEDELKMDPDMVKAIELEMSRRLNSSAAIKVDGVGHGKSKHTTFVSELATEDGVVEGSDGRTTVVWSGKSESAGKKKKKRKGMGFLLTTPVIVQEEEGLVSAKKMARSKQSRNFK